ncbi:spore coat protein [Pelosinus sp. sgz500959]|uniref:spore coat protein n=1 Tax=Pelosinus sp. sgz500959 TaxID=3242472 RepID=UPI003671ED65
MAQVNQQSQKPGQQGQRMQSGQGTQFADKDILQLALNESKHTAEALNSFILESTNEQLRRDYMTVLGDVYNQQKQVFDLMQQKGFYSVENATAQQISQVQSKFSGQLQ